MTEAAETTKHSERHVPIEALFARSAHWESSWTNPFDAFELVRRSREAVTMKAFLPAIGGTKMLHGCIPEAVV